METTFPSAPREAVQLLTTVEEALALLDAERDIFLQGRYEQIAELSERKMAVLDQLEAAMRGVPRSAIVVSAIRRLIAASRRNEQIIEAARQGLAHARRRIGAIQQAVRGVVAYAEDGTRIASRADQIGAGKRF
ncbi:MAG: hypothetical protein AB8B85_22165 [Paracoccaceae bacterium]